MSKFISDCLGFGINTQLLNMKKSVDLTFPKYDFCSYCYNYL